MSQLSLNRPLSRAAPEPISRGAAGGWVASQRARLWVGLAFGACLALASLRAYEYPEYSTDGFLYMANALAMSGASIPVIHDTVYRDAKAGIPAPGFNHLVGDDPSEPRSERESFRERAVNPYHFAEFLPCFAIRPIFNELIYVLHFNLGVGLLQATVLIPVVSYWLMGWVVWVWISRYTAVHWAAFLSLLLLLSPPLWDLARATSPDAMSLLVVLLGMYLSFEKRKLVPGMILLLASVFIRTDNALLVLVVLAFMYAAGFGIKLVDGIVLSAVAVASVVLINHFAGDYGWRVLYYRAFVGVPIAVGEITPRFGVRDYFAALRAGLSGALHEQYIPFFLMGVVSLLRRPPRAILALVAVTTFYAMARLIIFPDPEMRYFGPFFVAMGVALASSLQGMREAPLRRASSPPL
jgi:hypothetical protein